MNRFPLPEALDLLEARFGKPPAPPVRDPFELILLENASYIVDDRRRAEVFASLKDRIGTTPEAILQAKRPALLAAIRGGGMRPPMRADKLLRAAKLAASLGAPLARVVKGPLPDARKVLERFPGIAKAGAERLALLCGAHAVLGLESNGLRVLVRLGFATEHTSWDRTWREATAAAQAELPAEIKSMQRAHGLLRRHGQEVCRRSRPRCADCPLAGRCPAAAGASAATARR